MGYVRKQAIQIVQLLVFWHLMIICPLYQQSIEWVTFYENHRHHSGLKGVPLCESDSYPVCGTYDWNLQAEIKL